MLIVSIFGVHIDSQTKVKVLLEEEVLVKKWPQKEGLAGFLFLKKNILFYLHLSTFSESYSNHVHLKQMN